jgi:hypothetical protein
VIEKPVFIQGLFLFEGSGLARPLPFIPPVTYDVPADKHARTIYFRGGNPSDEMIYVVLTRNGTPMRYFPVGAKGAIHVTLAVVEDLSPGDQIEVQVGAPAGLESSLVLDIGLLEIASSAGN